MVDTQTVSDGGNPARISILSRPLGCVTKPLDCDTPHRSLKQGNVTFERECDVRFPYALAIAHASVDTRQACSRSKGQRTSRGTVRRARRCENTGPNSGGEGSPTRAINITKTRSDAAGLRDEKQYAIPVERSLATYEPMPEISREGIVGMS